MTKEGAPKQLAQTELLPESQLPQEPMVGDIRATADLSVRGYFGDVPVFGSGDQELIEYADGRISVRQRYQSAQTFLEPGSDLWQQTRKTIAELRARDEQIHEARHRLAQEQANGDPLLAHVLEYAIEEEKGRKPMPVEIVDGVKLYKVGGNASHFALLGVKDNRLYLCAFDPQEAYLFPGGIEHVVDVDKRIDDTVFQLFLQWYLYQDPQEFDEQFGDMENGAEMFKRKYGPSIDKIIRPVIDKYSKAGQDVEVADYFIDIPIDQRVFSVQVKPILSDVTDEEVVDIGRGGTFEPKLTQTES